MKNPKFGVTTFAVSTLAIVGFAKVLLTPHLPPSATDRFVTIGLRDAPPAATVEINWKSYASNTREETQKLRRPVLYAFLDPKDPLARILEVDVLRDSEVSRFVNRNFTAIKISTDEHPEVEKLILPITRVRQPFRSGSTLLITDSDGALIALLHPNGAGFRPVVPYILRKLTDARKLIEQRQIEPATPLVVDNAQLSDSLELLQARSLLPTAVDEAIAKISLSLQKSGGGISQNGYAEFNPFALEAMLLAGKVDEVETAVQRVLTSPLYDPIDGGFYESLELTLPQQVLVAKSVTRNAYAAEFLALLYRVTGKQIYADFSRDIIRSIKESFIVGDEVVEGRVSDVGPSGFSPRGSLTAKKLSKSLSSTEQQWVREHLMQDTQSGQLLPHFREIDDLQLPMFQNIRTKLAQSLPRKPQSTLGGRTYVTGIVCARLYRCQQLLRDAQCAEVADQLVEPLRSCWNGQQVTRGLLRPTEGWLGSYLALADALYQRWRVKRQPRDKAQCLEILQLCENKFQNSATRLLGLCSEGESATMSLKGDLPEVVDSSAESAAAQAIRLNYEIGTYEGLPALRQRSIELLESLHSVLNLSSTTTSALFARHIQTQSPFIEAPLSQLPQLQNEFPLYLVVKSADSKIAVRSGPGRAVVSDVAQLRTRLQLAR